MRGRNASHPLLASHTFYWQPYVPLHTMRKKVFITGGMIALFLILSSSTAFAANLQLNPNDVASIRSEIASGKPIKDVLEEHHITMRQIRGALGAVIDEEGRHKLSNTQIATIATKLGLDPTQIENDIASGKSLHEILLANNITPEQMRAAFGPRPTGMRHSGQRGAARSHSWKSGKTWQTKKV